MIKQILYTSEIIIKYIMSFFTEKYIIGVIKNKCKQLKIYFQNYFFVKINQNCK